MCLNRVPLFDRPSRAQYCPLFLWSIVSENLPPGSRISNDSQQGIGFRGGRHYRLNPSLIINISYALQLLHLKYIMFCIHYYIKVIIQWFVDIHIILMHETNIAENILILHLISQSRVPHTCILWSVSSRTLRHNLAPKDIFYLYLCTINAIIILLNEKHATRHTGSINWVWGENNYIKINMIMIALNVHKYTWTRHISFTLFYLNGIS